MAMRRAQTPRRWSECSTEARSSKATRTCERVRCESSSQRSSWCVGTAAPRREESRPPARPPSSCIVVEISARRSSCTSKSYACVRASKRSAPASSERSSSSQRSNIVSRQAARSADESKTNDACPPRLCDTASKSLSSATTRSRTRTSSLARARERPSQSAASRRASSRDPATPTRLRRPVEEPRTTGAANCVPASVRVPYACWTTLGCSSNCICPSQTPTTLPLR
mmetsp:Transcript_47348/g.153697  ORF Transcript_47348/g.153697 Transcript_47348/m.153697 type:complete len:227 (-) Transcript_47348:393-1073(-)